jgi:two-component system heavy metal sensor histidine kinase CusS
VLASNAEELERLARMISDMLFLAKADNGLVVPHREKLDLAAEVRDLFDFYDALAEEKGVKLSLEGKARAEGDRLMLRRAINNLLSNAIRHVPHGGWVRVRLAEMPEHALLSITNSGDPIPEYALPHLFERFYRLDDSRQRHSEGAGLGLAITRSIIAAHGGEIAVHSGAEGNRFEFWLPVKEPVDPVPTGTGVPNRATRPVPRKMTKM